MATTGFSSYAGMDDWYKDVLSNKRAAGMAMPTEMTATSTIPGTGGPAFDPASVGGDIGEYYTSALNQQPGYDAIMRNISGIIPGDTRRQIAQAAAERGVGIGSYGGANDTSALLRSLGLTSLDLTNKGLEQYRQAYATVPTLPPTSLFVNPTSHAEMDLKRQMTQAELDSAERRARETIASNERLGRISQQTQFGVSGANIDQANRELAIARADRDAIRSQTLNNIMSRYQPQAAQSDVWYSGTNTEFARPSGQSNPLPDWWYQQPTGQGGEGYTYFGPEASSADLFDYASGAEPLYGDVEYY